MITYIYKFGVGVIRKIYQILFSYKFRVWIIRCIRQPVILLKFFAYDMARFRRNYSELGKIGFEHRLARIAAWSHSLEKSLTYSSFIPLSGKDKLELLLNELNVYMEEGGGVSAVQWQSAVLVLDAYLERNINHQTSSEKIYYLENLEKELHSLKEKLNDDVTGGSIEFSKADINSRAKGSFPEMAFSRYSSRHFSGVPVAQEVIEQAVVWAQKSPSVCNRQGSRVHVFRDRKQIDKILEIQKGTRGFSEQIDTLLLVTGDLRIFFGPADRNQVYLDAGFFSMNLLYGLHYQGVGTCPLHWCVSPDTDLAMRRLVDIPDAETITAMIAVGSLPERFSVAHSQRRPLGEVLFWK